MKASRMIKSPVVVSSVQTQNAGRKCVCQTMGDGLAFDGEQMECQECLDGIKRRMQRFNPYEFGLLIIDEAHHAPAQSYRRVIDYYGQNPELRVLGVTATPDRKDEQALGKVFDSVAFDYELPQAIDDGWLVPIRQEFIVCEDLDFSSIHAK